MEKNPVTPQKRGFASMDAEKQRAIASKGGKAAHLKGTAHEFTSEEARIAGRKGGQMASHGRMNSVRNQQQPLEQKQTPQTQNVESTSTPAVGQREDYNRSWNRNNVEDHKSQDQNDSELEKRESA